MKSSIFRISVVYLAAVVTMLVMIGTITIYQPARATEPELMNQKIKSVGESRKLASEVSEQDVLNFSTQYLKHCSETSPPSVEKIVHTFRYQYDSPKDPLHTLTLYVVTCQSGAYNSSSLLVKNDLYDGLQVVPLASPKLDEKSKKTFGMTSQLLVGGITYKEKEKTLTSFTKGRGIGDMSFSATYLLHEDSVVLKKADYDGTADGKINPIRVYQSAL